MQLITERSKWLVFTSAGDSSQFIENWTKNFNQKYDLWIAYYGNDDEIYRKYTLNAKYCIKRKASKFQNFSYIYNTCKNIVLEYERFFILDDDIILTVEDIEKCFEISEIFNLSICGPSFTWPSKIIHEITKTDETSYLRFTNFVEVNTPLFSRSALQETMKYYHYKLIDWGIDYLYIWANGLRNSSAYAILDCVRCINPNTRKSELKCVSDNEKTRIWKSYAKKIKCPVSFTTQVYKSLPNDISNKDVLSLPNDSSNKYVHPVSFKIQSYKYLAFDFFIVDNILYVLGPLYTYKFNPREICIICNDEKLILINDFSKKYKNPKSEPCMILMYTYTYIEDCSNLKIIYADIVQEVQIQKQISLKKYILCLTTLLKDDYNLFSIFYEYYTQQGVQHFFMYYNGKIQKHVADALNYPNVTLIEWNFQYWNDKSSYYKHHAQPVQMHDALYKYGIYCDYMIFCDLDEYLYIPNTSLFNYIKNTDFDIVRFCCKWAITRDGKIPLEFPLEFLTQSSSEVYGKLSKNILKCENAKTIAIHHGDIFYNQPKESPCHIFYHFSNWTKTDRIYNCPIKINLQT